MPDGQAVEDRKGQRGLTEVEEDGVRQAFFAERGEDDRKGKVHGIDRTGGQQEPPCRSAGKPQQVGKEPGADHHRQGDQTSGQRKFPSSRRERYVIQRDENRRRQTDRKHKPRQPFRMVLGQDSAGSKGGSDNEDRDENLKG